MPKRRAKKKVAAPKNFLDTLISPDHRLTGATAPVTSSEFQTWLEADLLRLEAAWPHVGTVGLGRDRMKRTPLWPVEIAVEGETDPAVDPS